MVFNTTFNNISKSHDKKNQQQKQTKKGFHKTNQVKYELKHRSPKFKTNLFHEIQIL